MHNHPVIDHDEHFTINPVTRMITPDRPLKNKLMQNDHNSEQYSFDIPRFVDGHDMHLCTEIKIHYVNISSDKKSRSQDVYDVKRIEQNMTKETISFSWLISSKATRYPGTLNFSIEFLCKDENGEIDYRWQTDAFVGILIYPSLHVDETIVEEYSDLLEQWRQEILGITPFIGNRTDLLTENKETLVSAINEIKNDFDSVIEKGLNKIIDKHQTIKNVRVSVNITYNINNDTTSYSLSRVLDSNMNVNVFHVEKGKKYLAYVYGHEADGIFYGAGISRDTLSTVSERTAIQHFTTSDYEYLSDYGYYYLEFVAKEDGYLHLTYKKDSDVAKLYGEGYVVKRPQDSSILTLLQIMKSTLEKGDTYSTAKIIGEYLQKQ